MAKIKIGSTEISDESIRPYIIAEIGVNYYEIAEKYSIDLIEAAKLMIREAKNAGANAVKFQIYKAERLASTYASAYWDTNANPITNQYKLFKKYDKLDLDDYRELAKYARSLGIDFLATPFDEESAAFVAEVSPAIKVASADITNIPFLKFIAQFNKPIILSTGASNIAEIYEAVTTINNEGNEQVALLHCILEYPTPYEDANLNMIRYLKAVFPDKIIGYSDHTIPDENMIVLTTAVLLGARIIEKHFTLDKTLKGNDHFHSMDPHDLRKFVNNIRLLEKVLGRYVKEPIEGEQKARLYARRSIVAKKDLQPGEVITLEKIAIKRPATGIPPKFLDTILGKKVVRAVKRDQPLTWDDLLM